MRRWFAIILMLSAGTWAASATRLPVRVYTTADGLPRSYTNCILPDSKGFLWLCTAEGAVRYDGYGFTVYGVAQGLPDRRVNDIVETRAGAYLFATVTGISRLDPATAPDSAHRFVSLSRAGGGMVSPVYALLQGRDGVAWGATERGVYRIDSSAKAELQFLDLERGALKNWVALSLAEDRDGSVWIGTTRGLCRRRPDGRVDWYFEAGTAVEVAPIHVLLVDHRGHLWAGTDVGLAEIGGLSTTAPALLHRYTAADGLEGERVHALLELQHGNTLWVGTSAAVNELRLSGERTIGIHSYGARAGVSGRLVGALAEDAQGNLWAGADHGLMRIAPAGFATFGDEDGIGPQSIVQVGEDPDGVWAASSEAGGLALHRLRDGRFDAIRPGYGKATTGFGNEQVVLHTRRGEWWLAAGDGLYRFAAGSLASLAGAHPRAVYREKNGLPSGNIYRLFEDSRGDIWVTSMWAGLSRWDHQTEVFETYGQCPGYATAFAEDHAGNVWIGFSTEPAARKPNGVIRFRNGRWERFTESDGVATGWIRELYVDRSGKLWVGTVNSGLLLVEHPESENPRLERYTAAPLSSVSVYCITEDHFGRLFVGTPRGIDRIEPSSGSVRRYTSADGLAPGESAALFCDRLGRVWAGMSMGLSALAPEPVDSPTKARVFITAVSVEGRARAVGEPGAASIGAVRLGPDQRQLRVAFVGTGVGAGESLRYQHLLEGADSQWSPLTSEREVSYAHLGAGDFRFLVRAATDLGGTSEPAVVAFHVDAPVWQRWWFVALDVMVLGAIALAAHRYDVSRRLEVERMRLRIARDLHDDLGASLTRVAILSELAQSRMAQGQRNAGAHLAEVAEAARGMVDGLGDLVWAIDPRRDDPGSTARRIRQCASDLLETRGIGWSFDAPSAASPALAPDQRRHVLLFFQETLRNAARHAGCKSVEMSLHVRDGEWQARIADDGCGMPAERANDTECGSGLRNLRERATALGGRLSVVSEPGRGTELTLRFPEGSARGAAGRMRMLFRGVWGIRPN